MPPRVGDESAGMLIGWFSGRSVDWRRVLVTRVDRTVSVLDVSFADLRPPRAESSPWASWPSTASAEHVGHVPQRSASSVAQ